MRKVVTTLLAFFVVAMTANTRISAQNTPKENAEARHKISANFAAYSDYRFRGLSQAMQMPAVQGGFDYSHASGFYVGNWDSNISSAIYPNGNLEMDFYGGYKVSSGDFGVDVGAIYYFYPSTTATVTNPKTHKYRENARIDHSELYVAGSWKWLSLKYSHAVSDFFITPDTRNSWYLDFTGTYNLGRHWGVAAHLGRQEVKNLAIASYTDWKVGVTKEVRGYVFGLDYIDTNAQDAIYRYADAKNSKNIGQAGAVGYVKRTF